jgi:hypothetical protein
MRTLSDPTFDLATFMPASSDVQSVALPRSAGVQRGRRKLIVGLYLVSAPVATIAWVARTSPGGDLVGRVLLVLEDVTKPMRCS